MPENNNPAIEFAEIIDSKTLLSIDKKATICFFDLQAKAEWEKIELNASQLWGAVTCESKTAGVIAYSSVKDTHVTIASFDLNSGKILATHNCLNINRVNTLSNYGESQVIAYIPAGGLNSPDSRDGFAQIDLISGKTTYIALTPSPSGNFSDPPVLFCPDLGIGIRPSYENIEIKTGEAGTLYSAKIMVFDLETGEKKRLIAARDFLATDVFEDDDPGYALSCFELSPHADEYKDVRDEFMERFDSFAYSQKDKSIWITFQHGLLRRLSLDGQKRLPLIAHPGDNVNKTSSRYFLTGFDTPLKLSPDESFVTFGSPPATIDASIGDFDSDEEIIEIQWENCADTGQDSSDEGFKDFSWNHLNIESADRVESLQQTLEQLVCLSKEADAIRDGHLLRFKFHCHNRIISEDTFFGMVAEHHQLLDLIKEYVENLILFDKPLWFNDDFPTAFFAVRQLVFSEKSYLPVLVSYLGSLVDSQKEKEEPGQLIDQVIEKYGWCQDTVNLILTRAYFQNERGIEQLQRYLDSPEFKQFFSQPENKTYFKNHTLYLSLVEENFSILLPLEDSLFNAVESEDTAKVREALTLMPDLSIIHPDFDLTALELAFEVNNREIINLLISAGAEVKGAGYLTLKELIQVLNETASPNEELVQQQLDDLHRRKFTLQNEINQIEYNHMLNLQLNDKQINRLSQLNLEYKEIETKIKYANLGLYNFDLDKKGESDLQTSPPLSNMWQHNSDNFIDSNSQFEAELKVAAVYITNFEEEGQKDAFLQIDRLLDKFENLIYEEILRFGFNHSTGTFSEIDYFGRIKLTPISADLLEQTAKKLMKTATGPLWYSETTPCFFHAIQCLVLSDKRFIRVLISYLKSQLVESGNEPLCVSELVFDLYDHFDWCDETISLAAFRFACQYSPNAAYETRIQIKKGGLGDYLKETTHYNTFLSVLRQECCDDSQAESLIQMLHKLADLS